MNYKRRSINWTVVVMSAMASTLYLLAQYMGW